MGARRALKAAGIEDFRFHDLRHTCASYLASQGASLLEIGNVLGQRTTATRRCPFYFKTGSEISEGYLAS